MPDYIFSNPEYYNACIARHRHDKYLLALSALNNKTEVYSSLLDNEMLDQLPRRKVLGKQSVAKISNNRTAVLRNPFLCNGSINTLPRICNNMGRCVFSVVGAEALTWRQLGRPRQTSCWQFSKSRSEQIKSGTSGGSMRNGTRSTEEYRRSACVDVKCDWKISLRDNCSDLEWQFLCGDPLLGDD
jgi:hypothetical protein